jgi:hypothetical protein
MGRFCSTYMFLKEPRCKSVNSFRVFEFYEVLITLWAVQSAPETMRFQGNPYTAMAFIFDKAILVVCSSMGQSFYSHERLFSTSIFYKYRLSISPFSRVLLNSSTPFSVSWIRRKSSHCIPLSFAILPHYILLLICCVVERPCRLPKLWQRRWCVSKRVWSTNRLALQQENLKY